VVGAANSSGRRRKPLHELSRGEFWPDVSKPVIRLAVLTILIGFLAFVNYRDVKSGATVSNVFTVAKLVPLFSFAIAGGNLPSTEASSNSERSPDRQAGSPAKLARSSARNHVRIWRILKGAVVPMAESEESSARRSFRSWYFACDCRCSFLRDSVCCGCHPSSRRCD